MDPLYQQLVDDFLSSRSIAVAGFSREGGSPANGIYDRLKKYGYQVYAVNPRATSTDRPICYRNLSELPTLPEAVMICTPPTATLSVLEACAALGIRKAWIHRSVDGGSYVPEAEAFAAKHNISLLTFGCPMMFVEPDVFHRCMKWLFKVQGKMKVSVLAS